MCVEDKTFDLMIKLKEAGQKYLKNLITFDEIPAERKQKAESVGLKVYHFNEVI